MHNVVMIIQGKGHIRLQIVFNQDLNRGSFKLNHPVINTDTIIALLPYIEIPDICLMTHYVV